tara:strand:+ start:4315 stop:4797 length:483 start_codon:yes stop_codon:yes gene_type:complete
LGRCIVLNPVDIINAKGNINSKLIKQQVHAFDIAFKLHGQIRPLIVRKVNKGHQVVDGQKMLLDLRKKGISEVFCVNLGKLTDSEYIFMRIVLNIHRSRLDYIGAAELISEINNDGFNINSISTRIGLSSIDTERYAELLDFDWDDFNKRTNEIKYEKLF